MVKRREPEQRAGRPEQAPDELERLDEGLSPSGFDLVLAGASLHQSRHQREAIAWARSHAAVLNGVASAFFSVSPTAADDSDESRVATRRCVDELVEETGWSPRLVATFAGALRYREYDFMTRLDR